MMQVTEFQSVKPVLRQTNSSLTSVKYSPLPDVGIYSPVYYKPKIAFKSNESAFNDYYPTNILGVSEEKFDEMFLEHIKKSGNKNKLAEYIISQTSKEGKAMEFINQWKKQIPTLVSYNFFGSMAEGNSPEMIRKAMNLGVQNASSSNVENFAQSQNQGDVLKRDAKSLGRENQGLYNPSSNYDTDGKTGEFLIFAEKTADTNQQIGDIQNVLTGFKNGINSLINNPVSEEKLQKAKAQLRNEFLNNLKGSLSRKNIIAQNLQMPYYGLNYANEFLATIDRIEPVHIQRAAQLFLDKPSIISITASKDVLNRNKAFISNLGDRIS